MIRKSYSLRELRDMNERDKDIKRRRLNQTLSNTDPVRLGSRSVFALVLSFLGEYAETKWLYLDDTPVPPSSAVSCLTLRVVSTAWRKAVVHAVRSMYPGRCLVSVSGRKPRTTIHNLGQISQSLHVSIKNSVLYKVDCPILVGGTEAIHTGVAKYLRRCTNKQRCGIWNCTTKKVCHLARVWWSCCDCAVTVDVGGSLEANQDLQIGGVQEMLETLISISSTMIPKAASAWHREVGDGDGGWKWW